MTLQELETGLKEAGLWSVPSIQTLIATKAYDALYPLVPAIAVAKVVNVTQKVSPLLASIAALTADAQVSYNSPAPRPVADRPARPDGMSDADYEKLPAINRDETTAERNARVIGTLNEASALIADVRKAITGDGSVKAARAESGNTRTPRTPAEVMAAMTPDELKARELDNLRNGLEDKLCKLAGVPKGHRKDAYAALGITERRMQTLHGACAWAGIEVPPTLLAILDEPRKQAVNDARTAGKGWREAHPAPAAT